MCWLKESFTEVDLTDIGRVGHCYLQDMLASMIEVIWNHYEVIFQNIIQFQNV